MKILVTGGTGVIGAGTIPELLRAGHEVRLLSRGARDDARDYPERVEPFAADVTQPESLRGAAAGCEAVIHITGIVDEKPPEITYERINVGGTRHVLEEARRAGVRRFVYLSSLGADRGQSDYHRSKRAGEQLVEASGLDWIVLRPGNVYGPGDEVISTLLKMIRALPAIPMVGNGGQPFQPIWFADLGQAIARCARPDFPGNQIYEVAGPDITTTRDIIQQLSALTGRSPAQVPLPAWLAELGANMVEAFGGLGKRLADESGVAVPLNSAKLKMLVEGNVAHEGRDTLRDTFGVQPTRLADGLLALADRLPELLPEDGVGPLRRKRYWADIQGSRLSPEQLIALFSDRVTDIMPIEFEAEPGVPTQSNKGNTLTGSIPGRGNIQVRVEEKKPREVTFVTIEGHPLAGTVTFRSSQAGQAVRFAVEVHARAANIFDYIALNTIGAAMQNQNWKQVVGRMVELSKGQAPDGVRTCEEELQDAEAKAVEAKVRRLVHSHKRAENRHAAAVLPEAAINP